MYWLDKITEKFSRQVANSTSSAGTCLKTHRDWH